MNIRQLLPAALVAAVSVSAQASSGSLLSEGFDDVGTLGAAGWVMTNNSAPVGTSGWFQGNTAIFTAASGADASYIAANFENAGAGGAVSNWLMTPTVALHNGDQVGFSLRLLGEGYLDTVQVYLSTSGASTDVGSSASSTGDFSLLASYSATVDTGWTPQMLTIGGLPGAGSGRYAFRYVVLDTFDAGDYVGIDSVSITAVPEPASMALMALGLAGILAWRRRA